MMKRMKKALAEILLVCMMISNVIPAYAETAEILVGAEVMAEAPEAEAVPETVLEAEVVPAEPVEAAGADGDLVCAEIIEAADLSEKIAATVLAAEEEKNETLSAAPANYQPNLTVGNELVGSDPAKWQEADGVYTYVSENYSFSVDMNSGNPNLETLILSKELYSGYYSYVQNETNRETEGVISVNCVGDETLNKLGYLDITITADAATIDMTAHDPWAITCTDKIEDHGIFYDGICARDCNLTLMDGGTLTITSTQDTITASRINGIYARSFKDITSVNIGGFSARAQSLAGQTYGETCLFINGIYASGDYMVFESGSSASIKKISASTKNIAQIYGLYCGNPQTEITISDKTTIDIGSLYAQCGYAMGTASASEIAGIFAINTVWNRGTVNIAVSDEEKLLLEFVNTESTVEDAFAARTYGICAEGSVVNEGTITIGSIKTHMDVAASEPSPDNTFIANAVGIQADHTRRRVPAAFSAYPNSVTKVGMNGGIEAVANTPNAEGTTVISDGISAIGDVKVEAATVEAMSGSVGGTVKSSANMWIYAIRTPGAVLVLGNSTVNAVLNEKGQSFDSDGSYGLAALDCGKLIISDVSTVICDGHSSIAPGEYQALKASTSALVEKQGSLVLWGPEVKTTQIAGGTGTIGLGKDYPLIVAYGSDPDNTKTDTSLTDGSNKPYYDTNKYVRIYSSTASLYRPNLTVGTELVGSDPAKWQQEGSIYTYTSDGYEFSVDYSSGSAADQKLVLTKDCYSGYYAYERLGVKHEAESVISANCVIDSSLEKVNGLTIEAENENTTINIPAHDSKALTSSWEDEKEIYYGGICLRDCDLNLTGEGIIVTSGEQTLTAATVNCILSRTTSIGTDVNIKDIAIKAQPLTERKYGETAVGLYGISTDGDELRLLSENSIRIDNLSADTKNIGAIHGIHAEDRTKIFIEKESSVDIGSLKVMSKYSAGGSAPSEAMGIFANGGINNAGNIIIADDDDERIRIECNNTDDQIQGCTFKAQGIYCAEKLKNEGYIIVGNIESDVHIKSREQMQGNPFVSSATGIVAEGGRDELAFDAAPGSVVEVGMGGGISAVADTPNSQDTVIMSYGISTRGDTKVEDAEINVMSGSVDGKVEAGVYLWMRAFMAAGKVTVSGDSTVYAVLNEEGTPFESSAEKGIHALFCEALDISGTSEVICDAHASIQPDRYQALWIEKNVKVRDFGSLVLWGAEPKTVSINEGDGEIQLGEGYRTKVEYGSAPYDTQTDTSLKNGDGVPYYELNKYVKIHNERDPIKYLTVNEHRVCYTEEPKIAEILSDGSLADVGNVTWDDGNHILNMNGASIPAVGYSNPDGGLMTISLKSGTKNKISGVTAVSCGNDLLITGKGELTLNGKAETLSDIALEARSLTIDGSDFTVRSGARTTVAVYDLKITGGRLHTINTAPRTDDPASLVVYNKVVLGKGIGVTVPKNGSIGKYASYNTVLDKNGRPVTESIIEAVSPTPSPSPSYTGGGTTANRKITYSSYWFVDTDNVWRIRNKAGEIVKNAWLCDDAVAANGQNAWYLVGTDGSLITSGLVQDASGNYYSLETAHNGYYGMMRYQNGTYDGIAMEFSQKHDGTFGAITNQSAIDALKAKYGVTTVGIGNDSCVYTKAF